MELRTPDADPTIAEKSPAQSEAEAEANLAFRLIALTDSLNLR
jgi:hypothetical protein